MVRLLASAGWDETIKLWKVATGKEIASIEKQVGHFSSVAFSPDGKTLAAGTFLGGTMLWDVATMKNSVTLADGVDICPTHLAFSPDSKILASGSLSALLTLWDSASGRKAAALEASSVSTGKRTAIHGGHDTEPIGSLAFSPDGKTLASAAWHVGTNGLPEGTIRLWDVATGRNTTTIHGHAREVTSVAYSPDGNTLASGSEDKTIKLWDLKAAKRSQ